MDDIFRQLNAAEKTTTASSVSRMPMAMHGGRP
jgi:hypothetical protein